MPDKQRRLTQPQEDSLNWGLDLTGAICDACGWAFLMPPGVVSQQCPHCFQKTLLPLQVSMAEVLHNHPPELYLPFNIDLAQLTPKIDTFANSIPFAPADLKTTELHQRLQKIYLPMWLVDVLVEAKWQGEVGFNYKVVSHQEQYKDDRWLTHEVTETRIRWEPRVGMLNRTYHNVALPALEDDPVAPNRLGKFNLSQSESYSPAALADALLRLPNRSPNDAWPDALPLLRALGGEECKSATTANHIQAFQWQATYQNLNWTAQLLPLYTTYYLDDDQNPQRLLINGQTGQLIGVQRASMKRARWLSTMIGVIVGLIFICSMGVGIGAFFEAQLLPLSALGLLGSLILGVMALIPMIIVWQFNRKQAAKPPIW